MKTFLDYTGSKHQVKKQILEEINKKEFDLYVEPFLGSGTILFELAPKNAIINDLNSNLINCYIMIRDNFEKVKTQFITLWKEYKDIEDKKKYYYTKRDLFNKIKYRFKLISETDKTKEERIELAVIFLFINKSCYKSLYRENKKGGFNSPYGIRNLNTPIKDEYWKNVEKISKYLNDENIKIYNLDYVNILEMVKEKTNMSIYLDPPYYPNENYFNYTNIFLVKEQEELTKIIFSIHKNNRILVSNSYSPEVERMYSKYKFDKIEFDKITLKRYMSKKNKNGFYEYLIKIR